jgi:phospholipid/cholesterol/gamma-HCH transport system substrate-binding protein
METFTSIQSAAGAIEVAGGEVAVMVRGMNTAVGNNENQIRRIVQKTEESLDELRLTLRSVRGLIDGTMPREAAAVADLPPGLVAQVGQPGAERPPIGPAPPLDPDAPPPVGLRQALQGLPDVMRKAEATLQKTEQTLDKFQEVAGAAQRNLENLEEFTKPLGAQGQQLFQDVGTTINNVDTLVLQLTEFSRALNNPDSTVGQLVHDRELYDRLNSAIANVEQVTERMRPILSDVRVFTDKVARDPSRLIKGALDRRSPGMGLKRTYK